MCLARCLCVIADKPVLAFEDAFGMNVTCIKSPGRARRDWERISVNDYLGNCHADKCRKIGGGDW